MSRVLYGPVGDQKRIIPAPFMTISKTYQKSGNGDIIGKLYTLTLTGTIVSYMGSPYSDGTFYEGGDYPDDEVLTSDQKLGAIFRKQEALRDLFSTEGLLFEAQSDVTFAPIRCYPRINEITFAEGVWYDRCEYTIVLEADELYPMQEDSFDEYISSATESWTIDTSEEAETLADTRTYTMSHEVSAVGKRVYSTDGDGEIIKEPWQYAQDYVLARLGFDSVMALSSGVNNLPSYYNGWNHVRSENIDKAGGGFSVTENWLLASGSAIEDFTIQQTNELESPYPRVSINGNVRGFEDRSTTMGLESSKWDNVQPKFNIASGLAFTRAQAYSGLSLNAVPLNTTIGRNPLQGTIDYTFEYDARPNNLIANAKSENIVISDNIGGELFASVFVLGRTAGPVLQDLGTQQANTRSLNIEIVVDPPTYSDSPDQTEMTSVLVGQKPSNDANFSTNLNTLIAAATPSATVTNGGPFQSQPQESWDIKTGRYSYNIEWTYE